MRRPARPFAVEVRKSKRPTEREPHLSSPPAPEPSVREAVAKTEHLLTIDRVFARFAPAGASAQMDAEPIQRVAEIAPAPDAVQAKRILPDLTVPPKPEIVEEQRKPRQSAEKLPKPAKPAKPAAAVKVPQPKPVATPIARKAVPRPKATVPAARKPLVAAPVRAAIAPTAPRPVRRRIRVVDAKLGPGQRWKRRLPPILR